jgi:hypothetical protein
LFGRTGKTFLDIFRNEYEKRKFGLDQVLDYYNQSKFSPVGLYVFLDDTALNLVVGVKD